MFPDMFKSIRRLELKHDTLESKQTFTRNQSREYHMEEKPQSKTMHISQVNIKEESTVRETSRGDATVTKTTG